MAEVAKWLTHLTVDQAFVGSRPIFRPILLKFPPKIGPIRYNEMEGFYMNRRPSEWLKWVKLYVNDGVPITKIADKSHAYCVWIKWEFA